MRVVYAALLRLFPRPFRARFGAELVSQAREDVARARRRGVARGVLVFVATVLDLIRAALAERVSPSWIDPSSTDTEEGGMRMALSGWTRELTLAARTLVRSPGFALTAVATLALAIGVNAAIYNVVDEVLLEPLPFDDADRLVYIAASAPGSDFPEEFGVSAEFYVQYAEQADQLESLATFNSFTATLRVGDRVERVPSSMPSYSLFEVLGTEPALGRLPVVEDGDDVMVLSYAAWLDWFGGDSTAVGETHFAIDRPRTIVGVMPRDFRFPRDGTLLWAPRELDVEDIQVGRFGLPLVGRMRPGADHASLTRQLGALARRLPERFGGSARYAELIEQHVPVVRPLKEEVLGSAAGAIGILMAAVAVVLLIACANVANLFSVRAEGRQRDLAVRQAMGAGRRELIRSLMGEAIWVAFLAGLAALGVAAVVLPVLLSAAPDLPIPVDGSLSPASAWFTLAASAFAALACGLVPALKASLPRLDRLREGGRGSTRRRRWGRDALVAAQTALALVLLIGSGLLVRSFAELRNVDPGYETDDIFTFQFAPEQAHLVDGPSWARFHSDFLDRLKALPGVESVGIVENVPLDEGLAGIRYLEEGNTDAEGGHLLRRTFAGGDYFRTMGIEVLRGRGFEPSDLVTPGSVVISEATADLVWPGEDPVGRRIRMRNGEDWYTVVGVVEDVLQSDYRTSGEAMIYHGMVGPEPDSWWLSSPGYVVKTARAATIAPEVRALVREVAPEAPMYRTYTMEGLAARSMAQLEFIMLALAVAAGLALSLGAIGLYGILSYVVAERTQEIGVRMALGAQAARVRRMVVAQGTRVVVLGVAVGLAAALLATRALGSLLFGVEALDPWTFATTSLVMVGVGALASYLPALRASSVDPVESMRVG